MFKKTMLSLLLAVGFIFTLGAGQSLAVYNPGGSGDLLLGSIYDVRAVDERAPEWENYYTIRNTSNNWVAFHLRFRAQTKSIEVWDHIILLSPYDVFWFDLQRLPGGGVSIYSADTETLLNSGLILTGETAYSCAFDTSLLVACGYADGALAETEMGYVEAIGLWMLPSVNRAITALAGDVYNDPDDPGAINVFDLLANMWRVGQLAPGVVGPPRTRGDRADGLGGVYPFPTHPTYTRNWVGIPFLDCPNVLQGEWEMGDVITGAYQLETMVAFMDFRTDQQAVQQRDQPASANPGVIGFPVNLLIPDLGRCYTDGLIAAGTTPPEVAWYLNPGVATTVGPTLLDGDAIFNGSGPFAAFGLNINDRLGFSGAWSLPDVERGLFTYQQWAYYINSTDADLPFNANIETDVVMTFPTKHLHYFFSRPTLAINPIVWPFWNGQTNNYLLCALYEDAVANERALVKGRWDAIENARCFLNGWVWDSEQNFARLSPGPSPFGPDTPFVRHEVNVIRAGEPNNILETVFTHGQFILTDWVFDTDQRATFPGRWGGQNRDAGFCEVPLLGVTIRKHNAAGTAFVYRSSMTRRQFTTFYDYQFANQALLGIMPLAWPANYVPFPAP